MRSKAVEIVLKLTAFAALFYLFLGFEPSGILTKFAPVPQTVFGIALLALFFARKTLDGILEKIAAIPAKNFVGAVIGAWLITTLLAQAWVLEKLPHVTDSIAYCFQAQMFAEGRIIQDSHPLYEFFSPHFFVNDGRLYSLFQPGWPLVLALGYLIGLPWIVNPLLGAGTLLLSYLVGRRLLGDKTARLALTLLAISPFSIFMSASYMAHPQSCLLGMGILYLLLEGRRNPSKLHLPAIGLMWGLLFMTRAFDAVLLAFLMAGFLAPRFIKRQLPIKGTALMLLAGTLFLGLQLAYNWQLTGDPLVFPQDNYFAATELNSDCHRLGFGKDIGCSAEHGKFSFPDGYYPSDALKVTHQRMASLLFNLLGLPLAALFILLPVLLMRKPRRELLLYLYAALFIVGYMLFYYHGNCYGPRFYFSAIGALGLLLARGITLSDGFVSRISNKSRHTIRLGQAIVPALALTMVVFCIFWLSPKLWESYHGFRDIDEGLKKLVQNNGIHNSVVIIPGMGPAYGYGFVHNTPDFDGDVIYARQIMDSSIQLMHYYPERNFYRYRPMDISLVKLEKSPWQGVILLEMQAKASGAKMKDGLAFAAYVGEPKSMKKVTDGHVLYFRNKQAGSSFTIQQYAFESGDYLIDINYLLHPRYGKWEILVNGKKLPEEIDSYFQKKVFVSKRIDKKIHLKKGINRFEFQVTGKNPLSRGYNFAIDTIALRKLPEGLNAPLPRLKDIGVLKAGEILPANTIVRP